MNAYSFQADDLLATTPKDKESPFYREPNFERKLRVSNRKACEIGGRFQPPDGTPPEAVWLQSSEIRAVVRSANLTRRQNEIVQMRARGYTFEEIGRTWGHTKQGAAKIFLQARQKLMRAFRRYRYLGLGDVYREETSRGRRS